MTQPSLTQRLCAYLISNVAARRDPDQVIGEHHQPYLCRWYIIPRNRWFNVYLHQFWRSDDDRALHDHPWWSLSLLLRGHLVEHTIDRGGVHRRRRIACGAWRLRSSRFAHRLEVDSTKVPVWTLFITGPRLREWGFHCPQRWVGWRDFTDPNDSGQIGRGCGEG